jgi:hypothetical protein
MKKRAISIIDEVTKNTLYILNFMSQNFLQSDSITHMKQQTRQNSLRLSLLRQLPRVGT